MYDKYQWGRFLAARKLGKGYKEANAWALCAYAPCEETDCYMCPYGPRAGQKRTRCTCSQ